MKWFRHMTDASDNEFLSRIEDEFGLEGYARWWKLCEIIAKHMDQTDRCYAEYSWIKWQTFLKGKRNKLETFLKRLENESRIILEQNGNVLKIILPKLLEYKDTYSKRFEHTTKDTSNKVLPYNITTTTTSTKEDIEGSLRSPSNLPDTTTTSACARKILDLEDLSENQRKVVAAIGIDRLKCGLDRVQEWEKAGYDIEQDVLPVIKKNRSKHPAKQINSLSYFDTAIKEFVEKRNNAPPKKPANDPPPEKREQVVDSEGILPKVLSEVASLNTNVGTIATAERNGIKGLSFGGVDNGIVYLIHTHGNKASCQDMNERYGEAFTESWRRYDPSVTGVKVGVEASKQGVG